MLDFIVFVLSFVILIVSYKYIFEPCLKKESKIYSLRIIELENKNEILKLKRAELEKKASVSNLDNKVSDDKNC